jgi:putative peptidoglycan lipid II flippase
VALSGGTPPSGSDDLPAAESEAVGGGFSPSRAQLLLSAGLILTVAALLSRILGWVRLLVIGSQFGQSRELDAYFAAFRIPDAIFQLVVAGALSAALIPVFAGYRARKQDAEAWRLASSVINLVVIALSALSLVMAILAPWIVPLITPGFDVPNTELTVRLTRVMLLSPVFVGMGAVVSGILNSYERFAVPAMAPLVYNAAIIAAAIFLAPVMGVEGLAVGVVVGSLGHLVIQLPQLARVGQRYDLTIGLRHPGVRKVLWLMAPRTLGLAAIQINFIAATVLASTLPEGSVTAYNYAFQLMQVPVGVVGVSVAIALFPTLSRDAALGRLADLRHKLGRALRILLFVAAPITAIMIVLREPVTAVFFEYGLFDPGATERTALALAFFTIGLTAHTIQHLLARTFYAMQDTKTPVFFAVLSVSLNIVLMILLVGPMGVAGLALALSVTAILEVTGLMVTLRRRIGGLGGRPLVTAAVRSAAAAVLAALAMLGGLQLVQGWIPGALQHGLGRLLVLIALSGIGAMLYLAVAAAIGSGELRELRGLLGERLGRRKRAS